MNSADLPKIPVSKKSLFENKSETFREKKFPKIEKTEQIDKKNKKDDEKKAESIFSPSTSPEILLDVLIDSLSSSHVIQQATEIILKKIISLKKEGMIKANFIIQTKHFDEIEVVIKLFDTNPDTYHIKIMGNEKIQQATINHQAGLQSQINKALPHIRVHILTPTLRDKSRFKVKKKKKGVEKSVSSWYGA